MGDAYRGRAPAAPPKRPESAGASSEVERENSRLRKAVTWLAGAFHEMHSREYKTGETFTDCDVWECQRARVVLEETSTKDIDTPQEMC